MPAKILTAARGMAWHLWPALRQEDSLIVPEPPPEGFLEALAGQGLAPPRFVTDAGVGAAVRENPRFLFTPFGWNAEAVRRNAELPVPASHPDPGVVRRVNSREFGLELEQRLFPESACSAVFCADRIALVRWLVAAQPGEYVAKGNHAHAGIGQLRFRLPGDPIRLKASLSRLCSRHGGVVIELRQQVLREWGILFRIARDGSRSGVRVHRLLSGAQGGYDGALVLPGGDPDFAPYRESAMDAVDAVARALFREGYFGPVGLDMYAHATDGTAGFRALVDINARMSMASPVHGLSVRFPDRVVFYMHLSARISRRALGQVTKRKIIDEMSFDHSAQQGVIRLSPLLSFSARCSLACIGDTAAEVSTLLNRVKMYPE